MLSSIVFGTLFFFFFLFWLPRAPLARPRREKNAQLREKPLFIRANCQLHIAAAWPSRAILTHITKIYTRASAYTIHQHIVPLNRIAPIRQMTHFPQYTHIYTSFDHCCCCCCAKRYTQMLDNMMDYDEFNKYNLCNNYSLNICLYYDNLKRPMSDAIYL